MKYIQKEINNLEIKKTINFFIEFIKFFKRSDLFFKSCILFIIILYTGAFIYFSFTIIEIIKYFIKQEMIKNE